MIGRSLRELRGPLLVALALVSMAIAGCDRKRQTELPTSYGSSGDVADSVNGYDVLADMLTQAGHNVSLRSELTPGLGDTADTIIFDPDSFEPPQPETIAWMDSWLSEKAGRTLIYIGRDFDAEPLYWQKVKEISPDADQAEIQHWLRHATSRVEQERLGAWNGGSCEWFAISAESPARHVRQLEGPWMVGADRASLIDAKAVEIELRTRLVPNLDRADINVLLASTADALVWRQSFPPAPRGRNSTRRDFEESSDPDAPADSQLIVIANGSFLMNLPLVNHEHRKLAGRLIDQIGPPGRVVMLVSDLPAPPINTSKTQHAAPGSMLDVFGVWPLTMILLQIVALMAVFGFSRWPLFGPPRDPPPPPASDFGRHVTAVADTLAATKDASYARERWQYYQENVRRAE